MTKELEPCPFCGAQPGSSYYQGYVEIECCNPKCTVYVNACGATFEEAADDWNARYKRTCKMEPHPDYDLVTCSNCGYEEERLILIPTTANASFDGKFCPNCGAEVVDA